jgi:hypothetical protein
MNDSQRDQQSVWQTEQNRIRAIIQGDIPALEQILADDYFYSNSYGEIITKADLLAALRTGVVKYESQDLDDVLMRVYGSATIVTGRLRETGTFQGQAFDEQFRITHVYIRQANQSWRAVAYHLTRLVEEEQNVC